MDPQVDRVHEAPTWQVAEPSHALRADGYTVFRNVFARDDIERLRRALTTYLRRHGQWKYGGKYDLRGLHKLPEIGDVLAKEAFLEILKVCVSPHPPVLTGECDLQIGVLSQWHKDVGDAWDLDPFVGPGADRWQVYKAAIYLQDQEAGSGDALKVRPGSHLRRLGETTRSEELPVRTGDVVVFDVRIDHAGRLPAGWERILRQSLRLAGRCLGRGHERGFAGLRAQLAKSAGRMSVFLTFGAAAPCTYAYERAGRNDHGVPPAALDPGLLGRILARNIGLIQLP